MQKTILILGAGTGGIITANSLRKKLDNKAKILLFEKEEKNVFAPSLLWLMVGKRKPEQVFRKTKHLARKGIDVISGNIESINPEARSVTVSGKVFTGDYMVIALGAEQVADQGLANAGYDFYTLEGASGFHAALSKFTGGRIVVLVPSLPFKCPAAPYEAALLINSFIRKKGLADKTEVMLYTPEPGPMPVAGKELSGAVRQMVEARGIRYYPEHQLASVTENTLTFTNGHTTTFDLLAFTPRHQCPTVVRNTALAGQSGWIEPNRNTLETSFTNVYAIGDNNFLPLEIGKPLPKAGVFAHYQAEVVAHNIAQEINGASANKTFTGEGQCFIELGNGKAGYAGGNFYASPAPAVKMKTPGFIWHWTKVWFEKYWFFKYF